MRWLRRALGSLLFLIALQSAALAGWRAGEAVEVEWHGSWYAATVLETRHDLFKIHYDGWGKEWDEWVEAPRLREVAPPRGDWAVGAAVDIEWQRRWWPGRILARRGGLFQVHYDGYGAEWDEWVEPPRLRARSGAGR